MKARQSLTVLLVALAGIMLGAQLAHAQLRDLNDPDSYSFAQQYLLKLINQERTRLGLSRVRLDPIAGQAARQHALDMLAGGFFSHWNRAGLKPTRRYNLLGGYDALGENIYYKHGPPASLEARLDEMIATLLNSSGHAKTMLNPYYTHVGLGFAADAGGRDFYGVQEFITRVGGDYRCPLTAQLGQRIEFRGRFDPLRYRLEHVVVGYEERPQPREVKWLMRTGSYSDADKFIAGYTPNPHISFASMDTYHDIFVDAQDGWFECQPLLDFKRREGLYYLFVWLSDRQSGEAILAATATVDVTK
jgi:uncharacterized protein YkwD